MSPDESKGVTFLKVVNGEWYAEKVDSFVHLVELAAATVFAFLFAVGVIDLSLQILESVQSGRITDPTVVIGFIDTGLLMLIIVEVYQTVVAYTQENKASTIVNLVIYTAVIAVSRKVIIFRTNEYATVSDSLLVAVSYAVLMFGLIGLLYVEREYDILSKDAETAARNISE